MKNDWLCKGLGILGSAIIVVCVGYHSYEEAGTTYEKVMVPAACNDRSGYKIRCLELYDAALDSPNYVIVRKRKGKTQSVVGRKQVYLENRSLLAGKTAGDTFQLHFSVKRGNRSSKKGEIGDLLLVCGAQEGLTVMGNKAKVLRPSADGEVCFSFKLGEKGDYWVRVEAEGNGNRNGVKTRESALVRKGLFSCWLRIDDEGNRLMDSGALVRENKMRIWRDYYDSDPLAWRNGIPEAIVKAYTEEPPDEYLPTVYKKR